MKFLNAVVALLPAVAIAAPGGWGLGIPNLLSPIPGYPLGNPLCLSDQQAQFIVKQFIAILTNPDRQAAGKQAQVVIADGYVEESDSINFLAGYPLGGASFSGKQTYIQSITHAPAIGQFDTLDIFHDCNNIAWRWNIPHLAMDKYPVRGINLFTVNSPAKGQIVKTDLEFSSIAWGQDIGWTCQAPPAGSGQ